MLHLQARVFSRGRSVRSLSGAVMIFDASKLTDGQGGGKALLRDLSPRAANAVQATPVVQPTVDQIPCPGRAALSFQSGQYMTVAAPSARLQTICLVVLVPADAATDQVVVTQDTSVTTTKPAYAVQAG